PPSPTHESYTLSLHDALPIYLTHRVETMITYQMMWPLLIFAIVVAVIAQIRVSSAFNKFSQVRTRRGLTGAQVAQEILDNAGIQDRKSTRLNSSHLGISYAVF